jgi:hypothetical protein
MGQPELDSLNKAGRTAKIEQDCRTQPVRKRYPEWDSQNGTAR